jgi:hypothetical protein
MMGHSLPSVRRREMLRRYCGHWLVLALNEGRTGYDRMQRRDMGEVGAGLACGARGIGRHHALLGTRAWKPYRSDPTDSCPRLALLARTCAEPSTKEKPRGRRGGVRYGLKCEAYSTVRVASMPKGRRLLLGDAGARDASLTLSAVGFSRATFRPQFMTIVTGHHANSQGANGASSATPGHAESPESPFCAVVRPHFRHGQAARCGCLRRISQHLRRVTRQLYQGPATSPAGLSFLVALL